MWIYHSSAVAGSSSSFSVFSGFLKADKVHEVGVTRYYDGQCTGTLGGFLDMFLEIFVSFIKPLFW